MVAEGLVTINGSSWKGQTNISIENGKTVLKNKPNIADRRPVLLFSFHLVFILLHMILLG